MKQDYAITFFYYDDIKAVTAFYEDVLGLELVLDQDLARIYRIGTGSYFGIVDGNRGHLRHQPRSAVLLTIVAEDVGAWHRRLSELGVTGLTEIRTGRYCEHFFFEDPAGYAIEIQRFIASDVAALFAA
jgi:catechol 2,3-dioxygenase-like lactoylglutathione lyase family enzyme